eukprot:4734320-Pyramimonas_sp.AAC.1
MGQAARAHVKAKFSCIAMGDALQEVCEYLTFDGPRPGVLSAEDLPERDRALAVANSLGYRVPKVFPPRPKVE